MWKVNILLSNPHFVEFGRLEKVYIGGVWISYQQSFKPKYINAFRSFATYFAQAFPHHAPNVEKLWTK